MHIEYCCGAETSDDAAMKLVPQPQSLKLDKGSWEIPPLAAVCLSKAAAKELCITHKLKCLGINYTSSADAATWSISLGYCKTKSPATPKRNEAYTLTCDKDGLIINGADKDGLFWGLTTLEQLLNGGNQVPCLSISDYPAFGLRYHHDDISRKQVSTVKDFKRIIRHLSRFKIKYYTPYMEDMLFLKSYPDIGKGRGRLKPDELKAIHKEAKKYNVIVFPTYSLIGHQENLLENKKYRKYAMEVYYRVSSYDPRKKILRPYLKKVIKDVCKLFPDSPYFHACFDETQGLSTELIIEHANWCAKQIQKHGKQMLMWIDMFKNHGGIPDMKKLDPSIILVEWKYENQGKEIDDYIKHKYKVSGLAGYNNWCKFVPDFRVGKKNIAGWCKSMKRLQGPGFGCSMWGDNGYENSRDLCWNLYAYFGECTWLGKAGTKDFEERFQHQFYGKTNNALLKIINDELPKRAIDPARLWRLFRAPFTQLQREIHSDKSFAKQVNEQLRLTESLLKQCARAKQQCTQEADHIDHYEVGFLRERLILKRLALAQRLNAKITAAAKNKLVKDVLKDLKHTKERYSTVWLRHNKRPNIEVSLGVYDYLELNLKELISRPGKTDKKYHSINLDKQMKVNNKNVYGLPIGKKVIKNIPYQFAPINKTHIEVKPKQAVSIKLDGKPISDLHFLISGQTLYDTSTPKPCLLIELYKGNERIFVEHMKTIEDICCWWDPLGHHMWAGNGLKYVNKERSEFAYDCQNLHGVIHLRNFELPKDCQADKLVLTANGKDITALFALTVETA